MRLIISMAMVSLLLTGCSLSIGVKHTYHPIGQERLNAKVICGLGYQYDSSGLTVTGFDKLMESQTFSDEQKQC